MGLQTADLPVNPSSEIDITTESTHAESHADEVQTPEANLIGLIDTGLNQDEDPADTLTALVNSDQDHGRRVLGFKREDKSGWIQKARSKQNITYESTEGKSFFAKYATKMEGYRDTVAGLKKEKRMLDKLAATGVVPQAGELKFYPDEHNPQKGRLLMEQVPGTSIDNLDQSVFQSRAMDIITSSAASLQSVHEAGVAVVDINPGTFVICDQENGVSTKIVDLELACDLYNPIPEDLQEVHHWYEGKDLGFRMSRIENITAETAKRCEIYLWAQTIAEKFLGPAYTWEDIQLSPQGQAKYEESLATVEPTLKEEATLRAKKDYERTVKDGRPWRGGESSRIAYEMDHDLQYRLKEATLDATLADRLEAKGIHLPLEVTTFLSRALSNKLEDRPTDFNEILQKGKEQLAI